MSASSWAASASVTYISESPVQRVDFLVLWVPSCTSADHTIVSGLTPWCLFQLYFFKYDAKLVVPASSPTNSSASALPQQAPGDKPNNVARSPSSTANLKPEEAKQDPIPASAPAAVAGSKPDNSQEMADENKNLTSISDDIRKSDKSRSPNVVTG